MIRDFGATGATSGTGQTLEGIQCQVSSCYYNKNGRDCTAGHITVGPVNTTANSSEDTLCATWKPKA